MPGGRRDRVTTDGTTPMSSPHSSRTCCSRWDRTVIAVSVPASLTFHRTNQSMSLSSSFQWVQFSSSMGPSSSGRKSLVTGTAASL